MQDWTASKRLDFKALRIFQHGGGLFVKGSSTTITGRRKQNKLRTAFDLNIMWSYHVISVPFGPLQKKPSLANPLSHLFKVLAGVIPVN